MLVYWSGAFGPEAKMAVDEASHRGVAVNVVAVPYSYEGLRKIAGPLVEALAAKGIDLEGYRIGDPFDEIVVWGSSLENSSDAKQIARDLAADLLPSDLRLSIVSESGDIIGADSRHVDTGQPTPGDAFLATVGSNSGHCSSGLGWENPGVRFYMESAGHCVNFGNSATVALKVTPTTREPTPHMPGRWSAARIP